MVVISILLHSAFAVALVWGPIWVPRPKLHTYQVQLVSLSESAVSQPPRDPGPPRVEPVNAPPRKPAPAAKPVVKPTVKPVVKPARGLPAPISPKGTHVADTPDEPTPPVAAPPLPPPPKPPEQVASIAEPSDGGITLVTPLMEAVALKYPYYTNALERKMDANWSPPGSGTMAVREVLVTFTILRDGSVRDPDIEQSSGDSYFDRAALRSVLRSSPFPPLPPGYPEDTMKIHFSFLLDPDRAR